LAAVASAGVAPAGLAYAAGPAYGGPVLRAAPVVAKGEV